MRGENEKASKGKQDPPWRLHMGIFWNNHFTTFTKRLEVRLLDYFCG